MQKQSAWKSVSEQLRDRIISFMSSFSSPVASELPWDDWQSILWIRNWFYSFVICYLDLYMYFANFIGGSVKVQQFMQMILRLMRCEWLYGSEELPGSFNGSSLGFLLFAVTKWHISGEAGRNFIMYQLTVYFLTYVLSFWKHPLN